MAVPLYDHVVIVIEENHGFGDIIGSGSAPYINSLANGGALLTNYFADDHPSEPNYMIIYAGSDFGIGDDKFHAEPDPSLATKVQAIGKTFVGYVQSGSPEKHNPWEAFPEGTSVEQAFSTFPTTSAGFAAMPALSFVIPNLNNDMHDGTIQQADTWLSNNIDAYAQWAKNNNSLLIITWDEDDSTGNNQVAAIFYGAHIVTGQYGATQYDHFNMCSTLAHLVGASPPRTTAAAIDGIYSATNIAPSVPTGLQASSVTATSLTLSWTQSTGTSPITYNVLDRVGATGSFTTVASGVTNTSRTVSGLTPSTSYNFEVVATGPGGTSAPSAVLAVTTLATSVAPSVPTGLRAASVSTTSVVLSWNASTGTSPITYSVLDRFSGTGSFVSVASGVSGTTATVTGLTPNTSYDFEVAATGPGGTSAPSTVLTVATASTGGGNVIYILEESSSSSGPWTAVAGSPFATTTDTVAGLQASSSYFFRITAQDTLLGVTSPPTVVGPVLTTGSALTESPQNTRISSPSASAVPPVGAITGNVVSGSLAVSWGIPTAIYDAALNEWTLFSSGTSAGVQIAKDGTIYQNTSNVLQEVYWNHTVYYEASTANQLSVNPGWWYLSPLAAFGTTETSPSQPSGPTPVFDDEFTSAPWLSRQQWQSGDMWELGIHQNPDGATTGASTWWVNPIATPAGASLFSISSGQLKLGVMRNPGGLGISEPLLGTIINNQNTPGGCYRLFGYYEAQITVPKVSGFFLGLDIENHLPGLHDQWSTEINLFLWTDGNGANVWFQLADDGNQGSGIGEAGRTLYKTNSVDISQPHIYGFDWQSDFIRCFIDGVQVGTSFPTPGGDWQSQPLATYIYTNGADYGAGDGTPSNSSLPAFALVDYYRIYDTKPSTTSGSGGGGTVSQADWIPVLGDPALTTSPQQTDVTDTVAAIIGPRAGTTTTTVPPVTGITATVSGSTLNVSWTAPVAGTGDSSHAWQINAAGQVVHNGVADTGTTGTVELLLWGTTIYRRTG